MSSPQDFEFQDGLILRQVDAFDFGIWPSMAFRPFGLHFGWSGFLQKKVQKTAEQNLRTFIKENTKYSSLKHYKASPLFIRDALRIIYSLDF
jgi:hypothetical protein